MCVFVSFSSDFSDNFTVEVKKKKKNRNELGQGNLKKSDERKNWMVIFVEIFFQRAQFILEYTGHSMALFIFRWQYIDDFSTCWPSSGSE